MQYSTKKQSWIEFINQSKGNNIKNETIDRNMNQTQSNNINYSNLHHPSVRISSNEFTNRKLLSTTSLDSIQGKEHDDFAQMYIHARF